MGKLILEERIKYPPFESYRFKPELLPIAINTTDISEDITKLEAYEKLELCHHHSELAINLRG